MRLIRFSVEGLFGIFNHTIQLTNPEMVTIVHGPNGFGKTTVLSLINALFNRRFHLLRSIPWTRLRYLFDNSRVLEVLRVPTGKQRSLNESRLIFRLTSPQNDTLEFTEPGRPPESKFPLKIIEQLLPHLSRIGPEEWVSRENDRVFTLEEVLESYGEDLSKYGFSDVVRTMPSWLSEFTNSINVCFVETQRLLALGRDNTSSEFRRQDRNMTSTVVRYSEDIASQIQSKLTESVTLSQSLDGTFPARLLARPKEPALPLPVILEQFRKQLEKGSRLMHAGLLDSANQIPLPTDLEPAEMKALSLYSVDMQKKLSIFDDLLERIELFKDLINEHFKYTLKTFSIDKKTGFRIFTHGKEVLSPTALSSGEQHELVLMYQLLFKIKKGSLILIDEPELSLHVSWQQTFLKDLSRLARLTEIEFLLATHSPQIIHDRWDLTVALKGPES